MEDTLQQIRYLDQQLQLTELTDAQQELVQNHRLASNLRRTVRRQCTILLSWDRAWSV